MLLSIPNSFANGTGAANLILAPQMNANFNAIVTVLNGEIEKNNIKSGSAICLDDTDMTISVGWTFSANPTFNAGGIADTALTTNIPKKDASNVFSVEQTFSAGIDLDGQKAKNFLIEYVAGLPTWQSSDKARLVFDTVANQAYIGGASAWIRIDYVGGYTGGAVSRYAQTAIVDDGDGFKLYFKTEGASPTVKITLKGELFPKRFYTELGEHNHTFTGAAHNHSLNEPTHKHGTDIGSHGHGTTQYSLGTHAHSVSGTTGNDSAHTHAAGSFYGDQPTHTHTCPVGSQINETSEDGNDGVTISGTSAAGAAHQHSVSITSAASGAKQAIGNTNIGMKYSSMEVTNITVDNTVAGGTIGNKGVNAGSLSTTQKLYGNDLTVKINATNVTASIKTAKSWAKIGDGTSGHEFHTAGTGELDASSWLSYSPGLHILEILEPESGYGCSVMIHIETS